MRLRASFFEASKREQPCVSGRLRFITLCDACASLMDAVPGSSATCQPHVVMRSCLTAQ